ncbi:MAG: type II toxin-antitoxin system RelE/ParE family toxin [Leptospiraceae bacterium]|nr:type II toxin-antitoxin system RelE/ParE family toxin [Leptospiraceae bacterium]
MTGKFNYKILLSPEAEMDIEEAVEWYENQKETLGLEFAMDFENALKFLYSNPKLYAIIYKEVRNVLLKKFPYAIFYVIKEEKKEVQIFAVVHEKRNPEVWKFRLELID